MSSVIKVEDLSKMYRLGLVGSKTVSEDISRFIAKLRGKEDPFLKIGETNNRSVKGRSDYVWALKDINFDIKGGERFGIIGKNGAGKSTLLKILSRVASPTTGSIKIKGRVASLLEVGTGFHPELTGRDNIFLNGAILGMTQQEIKGKFDSIVDFSGVERYIDTPVKRYSSGMYVRLAFAVAAHLEPEILIVDEVLAVGDAEFQKKCLGKMHDVSEKEGRTVIFVSHNLQAIKNLCQKTIILNNGEMFASGDTEESLKKYNELNRNIKVGAETEINNKNNRRGMGAIRFTNIDVTDSGDNKRFEFELGETIRFKASYRTYKEMDGITFTVALLSGLSRECITLSHNVITKNKVGRGITGEIIVEFSNIYMKPGEYPLHFELIDTKLNGYSKDVIDDITAPLVIKKGSDKNSDFIQGIPSGYFAIPSKMILNEMNEELIQEKILIK